MRAMRSAAGLDHRLIVEPVQERIIEGRQKHLADELRAELAAAAVAEHDGLAVRDGQRAGEREVVHRCGTLSAACVRRLP